MDPGPLLPHTPHSALQITYRDEEKALVVNVGLEMLGNRKYYFIMDIGQGPGELCPPDLPLTLYQTHT